LSNISTISAHLWSNNPGVVDKSLEILSFISKFGNEIHKKIIQTGSLVKVLEYLMLKKKSIQLPCIKILVNLTAGESCITEQVLEMNSMFNIILELLGNSTTEVTYNAICCIAHIVSSGLKLMNQIVHFDKLHKVLLGFLRLNDNKIRTEVMGIYHTFTSKGNTYTLSHVLMSDCLEVIAEQIELPHTNLFLCNLIALMRNLVINEFTENDFNYRQRVMRVFETGLGDHLYAMHLLYNSARIQNDCTAIMDFYTQRLINNTNIN
jgi:hypothetical protein